MSRRPGKCDCGDDTPDEDIDCCYDCWTFRNSANVASDCEVVFENAGYRLHTKPRKLLEAAQRIGLDKLLFQIRDLSGVLPGFSVGVINWHETDVYRNACATMAAFGVERGTIDPTQHDAIEEPVTKDNT